MSWDKLAIASATPEPAPPVVPGPDARVLYPFRPLLMGSVVLAGAASDPLLAALRETARSVATGDGRGDGLCVDTVVLVAPEGSEADPLGEAVARLNPGGHLIVVVENALSLRRFADRPETAGMPNLFTPEDRTGPDGSMLPTRRGLRDRLADLGLPEQAWWFPFPSHHVALSLVSENGLAPHGVGTFDPGILAADSASFDSPTGGGDRLRRAWAGVAQAGLLGDFAPAFAVAASAAALPADPRLAVHFGHRRRPAFDKAVTFARVGETIRVTRAPLHSGPPRTVAGVTNLFPDEPYIPGVPWQAGLRTLVARDGWTVAEIVAWARIWWDAVRTLHGGGGDLTLGMSLPGTAIDAIPRNLLHRDGSPVFIDAEWAVDTLTVDHLLVRGLVNALTDIEACGTPGPGIGPSLLPLVRSIADGLGMPLDGATLDEALCRESRFQTTVSGIETRRDRAWLAGTRLPLPPAVPDPLAERDRTIARLQDEVAALRAESERRVAAVTEELGESRCRTDRVIRYAAELDRDRGRLSQALVEAQTRGDRLEAARIPDRGGRYRIFAGAVRDALATGLRRARMGDGRAP